MTIDLTNVEYLQDAIVSEWRIRHKKAGVSIESTVEIKKPHDKTLQSHRSSALAAFLDVSSELNENLAKKLTS